MVREKEERLRELQEKKKELEAQSDAAENVCRQHNLSCRLRTVLQCIGISTPLSSNDSHLLRVWVTSPCRCRRLCIPERAKPDVSHRWDRRR